MKVWLRTFGCRANHYDSEAVRRMVERSGGEIVDSAAAADVAVFNSCAVTADAEADLRQAVRRAARENPDLVSTVMGCAAGLPDRGGATSVRSLPTVAHVIGGADLPRIADALGLTVRPETGEPWESWRQTSTRALLRVQDGCDEHCTFCATTLARGPNRSRPMAGLIEEARQLAEHHPEIVITGIHIGTYGLDIGSSLGALVEALVVAVPTVRFRLTSIEATEVDSRLAALMTEDATRVAPHLHAPLQSGSDRVLRRMGRHWYSAERYADAVERLIGRAPVFGLVADVIAGFPGETDEDHEATVALVDRLPFTSLHVFPYSVRPGTGAERMSGHVPGPTIAARARELRALGTAKAAAYVASRVGGRCDVVVVGAGGASAREGLTEDYLVVGVDSESAVRGSRFPAALRIEGDRLMAVSAACGAVAFGLGGGVVGGSVASALA